MTSPRTKRISAGACLARPHRDGIHYLLVLFQSLDGPVHSVDGAGKSLTVAVIDIFTVANFTIAVISALIGYMMVEFLRKRL